MRVKGGTVTHRRHKKVLDAAKGYYDRRSKTFKVAKQAVEKSKPVRNTRPVTTASGTSARCGSSVSTLACALLMRH